MSYLCSSLKLAFHDADTDTDILARIVARMSACRSACHRNNFTKSRMSDVSARILARMSVSVSASWNSSLTAQTTTGPKHGHLRKISWRLDLRFFGIGVCEQTDTQRHAICKHAERNISHTFLGRSKKPRSKLVSIGYTTTHAMQCIRQPIQYDTRFY